MSIQEPDLTDFLFLALSRVLQASHFSSLFVCFLFPIHRNIRLFLILAIIILFYFIIVSIILDLVIYSAWKSPFTNAHARAWACAQVHTHTHKYILFYFLWHISIPNFISLISTYSFVHNLNPSQTTIHDLHPYEFLKNAEYVSVCFMLINHFMKYISLCYTSWNVMILVFTKYFTFNIYLCWYR